MSSKILNIISLISFVVVLVMSILSLCFKDNSVIRNVALIVWAISGILWSSTNIRKNKKGDNDD